MSNYPDDLDGAAFRRHLGEDAPSAEDWTGAQEWRPLEAVRAALAQLSTAIAAARAIVRPSTAEALTELGVSLDDARYDSGFDVLLSEASAALDRIEDYG